MSPKKDAKTELLPKKERLPLALLHFTRELRSRVADVAPPPGTVATLGTGVLFKTSRLGNPRLKELAASMRVSPATLSPVVAGLVKAGLLTRTTDGADARAVRFAITPAGLRVHAASKANILALAERFLEPLSDKERDELLRLVQKLQSR